MFRLDSILPASLLNAVRRLPVVPSRSLPDSRRGKAYWSLATNFPHYTTIFIWSPDIPTPLQCPGTRRTLSTPAIPLRMPLSRPVCTSCVYGAMHRTRTDRYRQHRPKPTVTEQFSLDASTHTRPLFYRHLYCDLLTDLATGRIYPLYTKDPSASELVDKLSIFFALHPSSQNQYENVDRFIRIDPERNYRSEVFLEVAASFGYRLERTPERDKHANGVAERTVGVIALKANIAMLNPFPFEPSKYWDLAMTDACDTHSSNPNSRIDDSHWCDTATSLRGAMLMSHSYTRSSRLATSSSRIQNVIQKLVPLVRIRPTSLVMITRLHIKSLKYSQTDVTVKYEVVKMSSSFILSTSVVPVLLTCPVTMVSTSHATYSYLATPTPHRPVSVLLTTNVSTAHINLTCARTRTLLRPCSRSHPTLSGISRVYIASTASTLLSTIVSLLNNGENSAPLLVLHLLTTTTSLSWFNALLL